MSDLRQLLEPVLEHVHADVDAFQALSSRRKRKQRRQRLTALVVGLAMLVAGLGWAVDTLTANPGNPPASTTPHRFSPKLPPLPVVAWPSPPAGVPTVIRVTCTKSGPILSSRTVWPLQDGPEVDFRSPSGSRAEAVLSTTNHPGQEDSMFTGEWDGTFESAAPTLLPAGRNYLGCEFGSLPMSAFNPSTMLPFTVLDPGSAYSPNRMACTDPALVSTLVGAGHTATWREAIEDANSGLRGSDRLVRVAYPAWAAPGTVGALFVIRRGGAAVAWVEVAVEQKREWGISMELVCPGQRLPG